MMAGETIALTMARSRCRGPNKRVRDLEAHARRGLWEAATRFDPQKGAPFHAFAVKRIRGEIIDSLNADRTVAIPVTGYGSLAGCAVIDHSAPRSPEHQAECAELSTIVRRELDGIPARHADLLRRRYFREQPVVDIAGEYGKSSSWVSREIDKALDVLRRRVMAAA